VLADNKVTTFYATGQNLYAHFIDVVNARRWNNSLAAWETYSLANWAAYSVAYGADTGGHYSLNVPGGINASIETLAVGLARRAGDTAAIGDVANGWLGSEAGKWTGSAWQSIASAAEIAAELTASSLAISNPIVGSTLDLFRGDAYQNSEGRAISYTKGSGDTNWPTTLSTVHWSCKPTARTLELYPLAASLTEVVCTITQATGAAQAFRLELTAAQMATLSAGTNAYDHWFVANKGTHPATLRSGPMTARPDRTW
jgi:hypothetical protein